MPNSTQACGRHLNPWNYTPTRARKAVVATLVAVAVITATIGILSLAGVNTLGPLTVQQAAALTSVAIVIALIGTAWIFRRRKASPLDLPMSQQITRMQPPLVKYFEPLKQLKMRLTEELNKKFELPEKPEVKFTPSPTNPDEHIHYERMRKNYEDTIKEWGNETLPTLEFTHHTQFKRILNEVRAQLQEFNQDLATKNVGVSINIDVLLNPYKWEAHFKDRAAELASQQLKDIQIQSTSCEFEHIQQIREYIQSQETFFDIKVPQLLQNLEKLEQIWGMMGLVRQGDEKIQILTQIADSLPNNDDTIWNTFAAIRGSLITEYTNYRSIRGSNEEHSNQLNGIFQRIAAKLGCEAVQLVWVEDTVNDQQTPQALLVEGTEESFQNLVDRAIEGDETAEMRLRQLLELAQHNANPEMFPQLVETLQYHGLERLIQ